MEKYIKSACIISGVLLLLSLASLPIGFYMFLRIVVFISAILCVYAEYRNVGGDFSYWMLVFGIIAIIFNPLLKVYFGSKAIWVPIDIISATVFFVYSIANNYAHN